jgi:hypothetical protein
MKMTKLINRTARKSLAAALTVAALTTLVAGATPAMAWDQQATEAQMDNELNYTATAGHRGFVNSEQFSGAYASARPSARIRGIGGGFRAPEHDFQLEGR